MTEVKEYKEVWFDVVGKVAKEAGALLKKGWEDCRKVNFQDAHDVKLQADVDSETFIRGELGKATGLPIIGEENGGDEALLNGEEPYWVVDPLDGTYNYLRSQPLCCVSIGLMDGAQYVYGVIYDFNRGELYSGGKGYGFYINGEAVEPRWAEEKDQACLLAGFPIERDYSTEGIMRYVRSVQEFKKVRMIGSAALSLVYVAMGWGDVYYEDSIRLWDIAAGAALVEGAGGYIRSTALETGKPFCCDFCAAGKKEWLF